MSQSTSESVYAGRKIRTATSDEQIGKEAISHHASKLTSHVPEGAITFGEAASKGILKPGMGVVFKDCDFGPIKFSQEETGKEQAITFGFCKGVVFKKKDGNYAIFANMQIPSVSKRSTKKTLEFSGRFGRANMYRTLKSFISNSSSNISGAEISPISLEDFCKYASEEYLIFDYLNSENRWGNYCFFVGAGDVKQLFIKDFKWYRVNVNPKTKDTEDIYNIAVIIEGDELCCLFKSGSKTIIREQHTYKYNYYDTYIEIRGG